MNSPTGLKDSFLSVLETKMLILQDCGFFLDERGSASIEILWLYY